MIRKLTEEQKTRISDLIAKMEKNTSGEIVVLVVSRSDDYAGARWLFGAACALSAAFLLNHFFPLHDPLWHIWAELPAGVLGYVIASLVPGIQRVLAFRHRMHARVHQRAFQAFVQHGLHATRDHTGILILTSLLERRIEILADSGINQKVAPDYWPKVLAGAIRKIASDNLAEGLIEAVKQCGDVLARNFPVRPDDANELPNHVIVED